jgi:hypothetical protein
MQTKSINQKSTTQQLIQSTTHYLVIHEKKQFVGTWESETSRTTREKKHYVPMAGAWRLGQASSALLSHEHDLCHSDTLYMLPLGQLHLHSGLRAGRQASIFGGLLLDGPELKTGFYRI